MGFLDFVSFFFFLMENLYNQNDLASVCSLSFVLKILNNASNLEIPDKLKEECM